MVTKRRKKGCPPGTRPGTAPEGGASRVVLLAGPTGGAGKSLIAIHLIVGLLRQRLRVASIDLDGGHAGLSAHIECRQALSEKMDAALPLPNHRLLVAAASGTGVSVPRARLDAVVDELSRDHDVTVIDGPPSGPLLAATLTHADVLVTPLGDWPSDLALLGRTDPRHPDKPRLGTLALAVRQERARRKAQAGRPLDWIVVRNRKGAQTIRGRKSAEEALQALARAAGFRIVDGMAERRIFRELVGEGLTVLDLREQKVSFAMAFAHVTARQEIRRLLKGIGDFRPDRSGRGPRTSRRRLPASPAPAAPPKRHDGARRILLLYDPAGGRRGRRIFQRALRTLAAHGCQVTVREIEAAGEAERYARGAAEEGYDAVAAAGADALVSEVMAGLAGSAVPFVLLPLAARSLVAAETGQVADPDAIAAAVLSGEPRTLRLGRVGNRTFATAVAVGFPAAVFSAMGAVSGGWGRKFTWALRGLAQTLRGPREAYTVTIGDRIYTAASVLVVTDPRLAGLGEGEATGDGAPLLICVCHGAGRWNAMRYCLALPLRRLGALPDVEVIRARTASITGPEGNPVYVDGLPAATVPTHVAAGDARVRFLGPALT